MSSVMILNSFYYFFSCNDSLPPPLTSNFIVRYHKLRAIYKAKNKYRDANKAALLTLLIHFSQSGRIVLKLRPHNSELLKTCIRYEVAINHLIEIVLWGKMHFYDIKCKGGAR